MTTALPVNRFGPALRVRLRPCGPRPEPADAARVAANRRRTGRPQCRARADCPRRCCGRADCSRRCRVRTGRPPRRAHETLRR